MNAGQMVAKLTWAEVDGKNDPDCRRLLTSERIALSAALQSGDATKIDAAMDEARRVCAMWGVKL